MHVLAFDIGTSSVKSTVLDVATGAPCGPIARQTYELDHPVADAAEIPPKRLWDAIVAAGRQAIPESGVVEGIGLSALTPALLLLDEQDQPLTPIWTHLDRRARPEARRVLSEVGEEFLATVGNLPLPGGISGLCYARMLAEQPGLRTRVRTYAHVNTWLGLRLTGERTIDRGNACFTGLYGTMTDRQWSERWCQYFKVERAWLPRVISGDQTIGSLRADAAAEMGLNAGIPVKLGTADTSSAMLAAGMKKGDLLHVVGTTQVLAALTDRPQPSATRLTRQLGVGDSYIHVTHNPVGGVALDWLHQLCFREQTAAEFYGNTVPAACVNTSDVKLDPPFLGGDRLEIEARRAAFRELTLASDRIDLLTALLQAMRQGHEEALTALNQGTEFQRVFLTGGGAEIVRKLVPRYAQTPVHILEEGSLRGVARLWRNNPSEPNA